MQEFLKYFAQGYVRVLPVQGGKGIWLKPILRLPGAVVFAAPQEVGRYVVLAIDQNGEYETRQHRLSKFRPLQLRPIKDPGRVKVTLLELRIEVSGFGLVDVFKCAIWLTWHYWWPSL